ncbi:MAG: hypothetical protein AB7T31_15075 [Gemmatimonadales bacterium]
MAYCSDDEAAPQVTGLGVIHPKVLAYLVPKTTASPLTDARFQALRRTAQEPTPIVNTKGQVPPPPSPSIDLDAIRRKYPCGTRTDPFKPCPEPPTTPPERVISDVMPGTTGPTFSPAIVPAPSFAPGGGGPVTVTVEAPAAATAPTDGPKGFGMVEAALAAGVAALLGAALSRKERRR